jgi:hypothetical protein
MIYKNSYEKQTKLKRKLKSLIKLKEKNLYNDNIINFI